MGYGAVPSNWIFSNNLSVVIEPSLTEEFPFVARVVKGISLPSYATLCNSNG